MARIQISEGFSLASEYISVFPRRLQKRAFVRILFFIFTTKISID